MPLLTEPQAIDLADGFSLLDDTQKPKAAFALKEYKKAQEENGLPAFPSLLQKAEEEKNNFRSMFSDLGNTEKVYPSLSPILKNTPDPKGIQMRTANAAFISRYTGKTQDETIANYDALAPAFAHQFFKQDIKGDGDFYSLAAAHVAKEKSMEDLSDSAQKAALIAATDISATANKALETWKVGNPDATEEQTSHFLDTYNATTAKLPGPMWNKDKTLMQAMDRFINGTFDKADTDRLVDMPAPQRNAVIASMFARASEKGKESDTGIATQTGKSFVRTLADGLSGGIFEDSMLEDARKEFNKQQTTLRPSSASDVKDTERVAEDARKIALDYTKASTSLLGPVGEDISGRQPRKLSPEEVQAVNNEFDRVKKGIQLGRTITQIERTADPVKSALASGLGSSAALMGVIALPGGAALSAIGYANAEYDKLRLENPTMDVKAARNVAAVSGAVQSGLDYLEFSFIANRLPSLRGLIDNGISSQIIKRGIARAGETFAFENIQEGLQDITTPVVQGIASRLSDDVPEVNWKKEWADWADQRGDVAIGVLPLTLVGIGVAAHADIKDSKALLQDREKLRLVGLQDADIVKTIDLATKGDVEGSVQALQEGFTRRDPEIAKAAGASVAKVNSIEADQRLQKLIDLGVMPKFTLDKGGVNVELPDGTVHRTKSWNEAKQIAGQHFTDLQNSDIDAVAQLSEHFLSQDTGVKETVTINPETRNVKQDVAEGVLTEQQARDNAVTAGLMYGMTPAQAIEQMGAVLGRNLVDTQNLVAHSATQLWKGANVLTVVEETVEGRWKAGLANGVFTEDQTRKWVADAEAATGEKFLHNDNLTEAVSSLVTADVLGSRKDGTRVPAGVITRGISSVLQKSSNGTLAGFLSSFRQLFKQVFQRAKALKQAKAEGKLGEGHQQFVDKLLGINQQDQHLNAVAVEAAKQAGISTPAKGAVSFTTAKGSTYILHSDGATTRDKAARQEHPGEKGKQPRSSKTIFVTKEGANALGIVQSHGVTLEIKQLPDGRWGAVAKDGKDKGKFFSTSITEASTSPEVGLIPVEMWNGDKQAVHFGNEITKVSTNFTAPSYSLAPRAFHEAVQTELEKYLGDPDKRSAFYQAALFRVAKERANLNEWTADTKRAMDRHLKHDDLLAIMQEKSAAKIKELEAERDLQLGGLKVDKASKENITQVKASFEKHIAAEKAKQTLEKAKLDAARKLDETKATNADDVQKNRDALYQITKAVDAMVMAFPAEVRGKFGGYAPMVKAVTNEAMMKHVDKKITRLENALEEHLKNYYTDKVTKIVKRALKQDTSGEAPKSKVGAEAHDLFRAFSAAMKMDNTAWKAELRAIESRITSAPTAEERARADYEYQVVANLGNIDEQTSASLAAAHEYVSELEAKGKVDWKLQQDEQMAPRKRRFNAMLADARANIKTDPEKRKDGSWLLNVESFHELLQSLFGNKSKAAMELVDLQRQADARDHDERYALDGWLNDTLKSLSDGSLRGAELLRHKLAQPSIELSKKVITSDGPKNTISEMEAGDLLLGWQQTDVRKRMEAHGVDEDLIDEVRKGMSPEALSLMAEVSKQYAAEYDELNPFYQSRHGVSLPRLTNYSPSSVEGELMGHRTDSIGPDGEAAERRSVLNPGFFNNRQAGTAARYVANDMLAKFMAHRKQAIYWKNFYEVAKEMQGLTDSTDMRDALRDVAGKQGLKTLKVFQDSTSQSGIMDASAALALTKGANKLLSHASTAAILGRISTLLVQTTQLGAASVHIPMASYALGVGKLLTGNLNFSEAFNSPFIQRRMQSMTPLQQEAMRGLSAAKPSLFRQQITQLGDVLGGVDAFFTAGTYAILLDYKKQEAASLGMSGDEAKTWANNEAERLTESTAQPIRSANRSAIELTTMGNPFARAGWAFASNPRMMASLMIRATKEAKADPGRFGRAAFFTFIASGLIPVVLKNLYRDARGDDDERKWSTQRMLASTLSGFAIGIPLVGMLLDEGNLLSAPYRSVGAFKRMAKGEWGMNEQTISDVESMFQALSLFHEDLAAISAMSHLPADVLKIIDNLSKRK